MSHNWNVILVKVPSDSKISILKAVREISGLGLKEAKDTVESAPISIVKTATAEEAEKLELKLKNAGAIVTIEVYEEEHSEKLLLDNLLVGENISFLDAMQQIKEQIAMLRTKEIKAEEEILTANNTLTEVQEKFKGMASELENFGRTSFGDYERAYLISSHPEIVITVEEISKTKAKLAEAEDVRLKRQEVSKEGLWSQIKSSVGSLFDMVDTYKKELEENYINLAKLIIVNDEQSENLNLIYLKNLISEVRRLYQLQCSAESAKKDFLAIKNQVAYEIKSLERIAQQNISLCSNFNDFEISMNGFDPELSKNLRKLAEKVIPKKEQTAEKDYPYAKNTIGGEVALIDDYVVISQGAIGKFFNFFDQDANVVKIPVENITVINFKASGILDGTIEFVYPGYFPKPNEMKHQQENVITFGGKECNENFRVFKELVEKRMREIKQQLANTSGKPSVADELAKFAKLHKEGVLTDEEFSALKAKLLGL
jgi:hypothetical protein